MDPGAARLPSLDRATALDLLREGELDVIGRLVASSNHALFCTVTRRCPDPEPDLVATCVYKPMLGERPLDDFPDGTLGRREVAAHVVSEATGWTESNVKVKAMRARRRMREAVEKLLGI